jgi:hypothetical protein
MNRFPDRLTATTLEDRVTRAANERATAGGAVDRGTWGCLQRRGRGDGTLTIAKDGFPIDRLNPHAQSSQQV